jgi:outer membrane receptor protein involved in Fe transport
VRGHFTARSALNALLKNSGLSYTEEGERIRVVPTSTLLQSGLTEENEAPSWPASSDFLARQDRLESAPSDVGTSTNVRDDLNEVIVSAQKRDERLQDVPVPVSVLDTNSLIESNHVRIQDYYSEVPGLNLTPSVQSAQNLSIRGITTGFANPTVGVTIDDVPFGSSLGVAGGLQVPDLDPSDLTRLEVLRGPQGTLYGASSMGGLFKFVTVDPSTDGLSGRVEGGANGVYNGDQAGYNVRGAVNVPLGDTLAVRGSAFTRLDPGYIDNVETGQNDINKSTTSGGRLSVLWKPLSDLSVKISGLLQKSHADGASEVDLLPGLGDLQQSRLINTGLDDREMQLYSAVIKAKVGTFNLTSVSAYGLNKDTDNFDYTYAFGTVNQGQFGVSGSPVFSSYDTKKFTQEFRATSPIGDRIDWLGGLFYSSEHTRFGQAIDAVDPATGITYGQYIALSEPFRLTEYAGFTDFTFKITDQFNVQVGGRESRQDQNSGPTGNIGPTGALSISPELRTNADNVFTYLFTPQYIFSADLMAYARLASGYRAGGGGTSGPSDECVRYNFPCQYGPDKTLNYELGMKGDVLDRLFTYDASIYYIDWKDIQIQAFNEASGSTFNTNGSRAKSQGIELSLESRPVTGMTLALWGSWDDAELTEAFPAGPLYGVAGDRLPLSSRFSSNFSLDQKFDLTNQIIGSVGGSVGYTGNRLGLFTPTAARAEYPGYAKIDLRGGLQRRDWSLNLYANNVADKRASLSGGTGFFPPYSVVYIQPRTVGMTLTKSF